MLRLPKVVWLMLTFIAASSTNTKADIAAVWLTQAGDAKIHITRCGEVICGRIIWLKDPIDRKTGKPQVDDRNPNPSLRSRKVIGLSIFSGMRPDGPNSWAGRIYNADDGKTYETTIKLDGDNKLKVGGCVGPLCGSESWSRPGNR